MKTISKKSAFILAVISATTSLCGATNLLVNGGFETPVSIPAGRPTATGAWVGDICEIVTASPDISPFEGIRMLQFINTDIYGPSGYSGSDLWQLIDVTPFHSQVSTGNAVTTLSAYFNRVSGDSETDTGFTLRIRAYSGQPSTFPSQSGKTELTECYARLFSDGNPSTWEFLQVGLILPTQTDFIAVNLIAGENVFNDLVGVEFDGHFADAVTVQIIPEPATLVLLSLGGLLLCKKR